MEFKKEIRPDWSGQEQDRKRLLGTVGVLPIISQFQLLLKIKDLVVVVGHSRLLLPTSQPLTDFTTTSMILLNNIFLNAFSNMTHSHLKVLVLEEFLIMLWK